MSDERIKVIYNFGRRFECAAARLARLDEIVNVVEPLLASDCAVAAAADREEPLVVVRRPRRVHSAEDHHTGSGDIEKVKRLRSEYHEVLPGGKEAGEGGVAGRCMYMV